MSLRDRVIALAEGRQLEDLAQMLEKEGALPLRCPLVSILDPPDDAPVLAWLKQFIDHGFDHLILLTGEGLRRILSCAERHALRDQAIAAVARTHAVTRGPKPVRALKEIGLAPGLVAPAPTTEGVIAALGSVPLAGKSVGVQLYPDSNPKLLEFLNAAQAGVWSVLPYVYAPAADAERVADLVQQLAEGTVHALVFTSSPQVDRLFDVVKDRGLDEIMQVGLTKTRVAAVGPVVAENLRRRGVKVDVCPEQGFVMKNLVRLLAAKM